LSLAQPSAGRLVDATRVDCGCVNMTNKRCLHGKEKSKCAECTPCPHGKVKSKCAECNPCPHGKVKHDCAECTPCPHGKLKRNCAACKSARAAS
jgi:hypothetical protein